MVTGPSLRGDPGPVFVGVFGIAKPPKPEHPFEVANEVVCAELGRGLRLPIPVGITAKSDSGVLHYVSFSVSQAGEKLPPANPEAIAQECAELACGVILFDLWIANADRTAGNLAYDEDKKSLHLIDHARALFCGADWRGRLGTLDDGELIASNCLTPRIRRVDGFSMWGKRIKELPEYYIRDVLAGSQKIGVKKEDADFCVNFLLQRRKKLLTIVRKHRKKFYSAPTRNASQKDLFGGAQ